MRKPIRLIVWVDSKAHIIVKDLRKLDLDDEDDCEEIIDGIRYLRGKMNEEYA